MSLIIVSQYVFGRYTTTVSQIRNLTKQLYVFSPYLMRTYCIMLTATINYHWD